MRKLTKGSAAIMGTLSILAIYAGELAVLKTVTLGSGAVLGIVAVVSAYITGNVADNKFRSENYHPEMQQQ